jgi:hypothetical protein
MRTIEEQAGSGWRMLDVSRMAASFAAAGIVVMRSGEGHRREVLLRVSWLTSTRTYCKFCSLPNNKAVATRLVLINDDARNG